MTKNSLNNLHERATAYILRAHILEVSGNKRKSRESYAKAASIEERILSKTKSSGIEFGPIVLSAASCYSKAGNKERANLIAQNYYYNDILFPYRKQLEQFLF